MRVSSGASPHRLPRLTAVLATVALVGLLVPTDVGSVAGAQSTDDLRQQQSEAEQERDQAEGVQAGVEAELDGAVQQREDAQAALIDATAAVDAILTDIDAVVGEQTVLKAEIGRLEGAAATTRESLTEQIRDLYIQGGSDTLVLALDATEVSEFGNRSFYLMALSREDRSRLEELQVITTTLAGRQDELDAVDERLAVLREQAEARQGELDRQLLVAAGIESHTAQQLAQAESDARALAVAADQAAARVDQAEEAERQAAIAAAEEAARKAEAAAAAAAAATAQAQAEAAEAKAQAEAAVLAAAPAADVGTGSAEEGDPDDAGPAPQAPVAPPPAPPSGNGMACPQDNPRSFTDTWGAPRSGGRSHQGTDIFGTRGGNVFAITDGVVTRTSSGNMSGLFLSLRGDDGNDYWYMHLQDFVASSGQRVSAGELIARNGDTGNARGTTPHIHFEHHPGGGGAVNPYPLLAGIC